MTNSAFNFQEQIQPSEPTSAAGSCESAALFLLLQGLGPYQQTPAERTQSAEWRQKQRDWIWEMPQQHFIYIQGKRKPSEMNVRASQQTSSNTKQQSRELL